MMMKYSRKRWMAFVLTLILLFTQIQVFSPVQASATAANSFDLNKLVQAIDETSNQILVSGVDHFDEAVGVALSGKQLPQEYVTQLKQTVTDEVYNVVQKAEPVESSSYYAGLLLQLKSAQVNPQDANGDGDDFVQFIYDITNRTNTDVKKEVLIATYVLIALDSGNYSVTDLELFKADLVKYLLDNQHSSGGWNYLGGSTIAPFVDETGMVITALAPYKNDIDVQNAITDAVNWLSTQVNDRGGVVPRGIKTIKIPLPASRSLL